VTGGPAALDRLDARMLAHGVTSWLPTVITTDDATAARVVAEIAERAADPASAIEGAHLEGPFLNPAYRGVHAAEHLRAPADGVPEVYASGAVRLVTLAPELPGALALVGELRRRGVAVALGHSGADAATARAALDAGARLVTHLFNAMAPLHHREPGPAGVALADPRAVLCVIADGRHVDPLVLRIVRRASGRRVVLVSDAAGPGVRDRAVLSGTAITLDEAVRGWAALAGASLPEALAAAGARPARLLGLGRHADLILLSEDGVVQRVMRRGRWVA
jgi:N-acetylglucosamine-6-phosphate deacetylase